MRIGDGNKNKNTEAERTKIPHTLLIRSVYNILRSTLSLVEQITLIILKAFTRGSMSLSRPEVNKLRFTFNPKHPAAISFPLRWRILLPLSIRWRESTEYLLRYPFPIRLNLLVIHFSVEIYLKFFLLFRPFFGEKSRSFWELNLKWQQSFHPNYLRILRNFFIVRALANESTKSTLTRTFLISHVFVLLKFDADN